MLKKLGAICALVHLISVVLVGYIMATSTDPHASTLWLHYFIVDYPIAIGLWPLSFVVVGHGWTLNAATQGSILNSIGNFWMPALYLGIVGTIWWYFLPRLIGKLIRWVKGASDTSTYNKR